MRKRILIGLAVLAVLGVGAYLLSQPSKGSVEYHKEKYREAYEWSNPTRDAQTPVVDWIILHAPDAVNRFFWRRNRKRIDFHRNALLEAGYLVQRDFVVSNRPASDLASDLRKMSYVFTDTNDVAGIPFFWSATDGVRVRARASDIAKWEDVIRRFDVPETQQ